MAQLFVIHPDNPQPRLIRRAPEIVRAGGIIVYPTDSCYALGCHLGDKTAADRMRAIRQVDARHHFALVCRDLAEIAVYAKVDNSQFRLLMANTPGKFLVYGDVGYDDSLSQSHILLPCLAEWLGMPHVGYAFINACYCAY